MWKRVALAGLAGFLISIFWMFLGLVLFNVGNGLVANLYYLVGEIVCPFFPVNSAHDVYGPFVNAVLYASLAWIILRMIKSRHILPSNV